MEGWRETGLPLPSLTPPEAQTPQREPTTASFTSFPLDTWDKSQEGTGDDVVVAQTKSTKLKKKASIELKNADNPHI